MVRAQGKLTEAETLFRQTLTGLKKLLGDNHPAPLTTMNNPAVLGKLSEAEALYTQALAAKRKVLGETLQSTLQSLNDLASVKFDQGRAAIQTGFRWQRYDLASLKLVPTILIP